MISDGLQINGRRTGTTVRITASGEIDIATAPRLREYASRHLADDAEIVVLDLTDITFIDSSGLHALLQAAAHEGNRLRIMPSPACLRLIDIASVRDRLPLIDTPSAWWRAEYARALRHRRSGIPSPASTRSGPDRGG